MLLPLPPPHWAPVTPAPHLSLLPKHLPVLVTHRPRCPRKPQLCRGGPPISGLIPGLSTLSPRLWPRCCHLLCSPPTSPTPSPPGGSHPSFRTWPTCRLPRKPSLATPLHPPEFSGSPRPHSTLPPPLTSGASTQRTSLRLTCQGLPVHHPLPAPGTESRLSSMLAEACSDLFSVFPPGWQAA